MWRQGRLRCLTGLRNYLEDIEVAVDTDVVRRCRHGRMRSDDARTAVRSGCHEDPRMFVRGFPQFPTRLGFCLGLAFGGVQFLREATEFLFGFLFGLFIHVVSSM